MKLLGLDFDNTLICYDKLFHKLALEKNLINDKIPADKVSIRNYIRSQGNDEQFTILQGEVYGNRILEAGPATGMLSALQVIKNKKIKFKIINYKKKQTYKGPKYDLRKAALSWLDMHGFFANTNLDLKLSDVYFEDSKEEKVKKIHELGCTHYIDDLPEILEMISDNVEKILYRQKISEDIQFHKMTSWKQLAKILKCAQ